MAGAASVDPSAAAPPAARPAFLTNVLRSMAFSRSFVTLSGVIVVAPIPAKPSPIVQPEEASAHSTKGEAGLCLPDPDVRKFRLERMRQPRRRGAPQRRIPPWTG